MNKIRAWIATGLIFLQITSPVMGESLLGTTNPPRTNMTLTPGSYEEVYIAFRGLDAINLIQHQEALSFTQEDNYINGPKNEESPKYTTLSVRPDRTAYLDNVSYGVRGLFQFLSPAGDNVMLMATENAIYKSSGDGWQSLQTGLSDNPWEGSFYSDPNVSRMYLCNGINPNYKYLSGQPRLLKMQNQDDETAISGSVWFTAGSPAATASAVAISSLEAGRYIKYSTAGDDTKWVEIVSIEGTALKFSTPYTGVTSAFATVVRSNYVDDSRYILNYEGYMALGYISHESTTSITTTASTDVYGVSLAYGVAQSFTAASTFLTKIGLKIGQYSADTSNGNIVLKIKSSLTSSTSLVQITYPIANLPSWGDSSVITYFDFGNTALTDGSTYYLTIERENSSAGYFQIIQATAYTGGNSYTTYNSTGFDASWNVGLTTLEVAPQTDPIYATLLGNFGTYTNTNLKEEDPGVSLNSPLATTLVGKLAGYTWKTIIHWYLDMGCITTEASNWTNVKLQLYKVSATSGEVTAFKKLTGVYNPWNNASWTVAGCSGIGTDYTVTNKATTTIASTSYGWVTLEVTAIAKSWTTAAGGNYGIVITGEGLTYGGDVFYFYGDGAPASLRPRWILTTNTGKTDNRDIWFEVQADTTQSSTVIYSKKYKPENYPQLNTFQIPGRIVGLAQSGGYLIVGGKNPDALYYYLDTGDTRDGYAFGDKPAYVAKGYTFGSSKSISYLPKDGGFIFYSGAGVYRCLGQQVELVSGQIKNEAETFGGYRDPRMYYAGLASFMPRSVTWWGKDLYLLSEPENQYIHVYNYADGSWCRWTSLEAASLFVRDNENMGGTKSKLYMGDNDGQVWTLNNSGSVTKEAVLRWYLINKDITKEKQLDYVEFHGRADNPLYSSIITLEVAGVDQPDYVATTTFPLIDNTTTDKMVHIECQPVLNCREYRLTLTQSSTAGAVSWRSARFKYKVF